MKKDEQSNTADNIVGKKDDREEEKVETPALLVPQQLLPTLVENNATGWSSGKVAALVATVVLVGALLALYIHGAAIAAA